MNSSRHKLDFYESPTWFTTELLRHVNIQGTVLEPCVGNGAIADILELWGCNLWTNDIDPEKGADYHLDATEPEAWSDFPQCDWVITNPPYSDKAVPIIKNAYNHATKGVAAFLLNGFIEPCSDRDDFLAQHPPSLVLVYPRYCFRKDKSGQRWTTDNQTINCFVWVKNYHRQHLIIRTQNAIAGFYKNSDSAITFDDVDAIVQKIKNGAISTNYGRSTSEV